MSLAYARVGVTHTETGTCPDMTSLGYPSAMLSKVKIQGDRNNGSVLCQSCWHEGYALMNRCVTASGFVQGSSKGPRMCPTLPDIMFSLQNDVCTTKLMYQNSTLLNAMSIRSPLSDKSGLEWLECQSRQRLKPLNQIVIALQWAKLASKEMPLLLPNMVELIPPTAQADAAKWKKQLEIDGAIIRARANRKTLADALSRHVAQSPQSLERHGEDSQSVAFVAHCCLNAATHFFLGNIMIAPVYQHLSATDTAVTAPSHRVHWSRGMSKTLTYTVHRPAGVNWSVWIWRPFLTTQ